MKPVKFEQNLRDSLFTFCHDEAPLSNLFNFVHYYHNYSCTYLKYKVFSLRKKEGLTRDLDRARAQKSYLTRSKIVC